MTAYTADELSPHPWIDASFFERTIRSYEKNSTCTVESFTIRPATKPGDHFASVMFKVDVIYSSNPSDNKTIQLIMKTYPSHDGVMKKFLSVSPAFRQEATMYANILPEMERVLESIGEHVKFSPKLVYENLKTEPLPVIVFEDMSPKGFQTFDPAGVTNLGTMEVIIKKLVKFHAASMYLQENGGNLNEFNRHFLKDKIEDETKNPSMQIFRKGFDLLADEMKKWGPEFEMFSNKMQGKADKLFKDMLKVFHRDTSFKVLCHGDFHGKNLLYRNECFKDEDLLMIDHQFPFWGSPSIDLYFVFNNLAHSDLTKLYRDKFILFYYLELDATLKRLSYKGKIPTLHDLYIELIECSSLDVFHLTTLIPTRFMDYTKVNLELWDEDPDMMYELTRFSYEDPVYRQFIEENLERLLSLGALDL